MAGVPLTPECEFCFGQEDVRETDGLIECKGCREYRQWFQALTPEEQRQEHEMAAQYVQDTIDRGDE
jgi:hypothetical protein